MMGSDHTPIFLPRATTTDHLATLDQVVMARVLGTVGGPSGSGKTALVGHWITTRSIRMGSNPHDRVVVIALPRGNPTVPMEYTVCLRVWKALQRMAGTHYLIPQRFQHTTYRTYSKRNLEWLSIAVSELLEQCPIRAIVIENAQYLDQCALERVLEWRTWYDEQRGRVVRRALILVATMAERDDPLTALLQTHNEASALWGTHIALTYLNRSEFFPVLGAFLDGPLHADFSPALAGQLDQVGETLFRRVQGNWHYVMALLQQLDVALGPPVGRRRRVITPAVLQRVVARRPVWEGMRDGPADPNDKA